MKHEFPASNMHKRETALTKRIELAKNGVTKMCSPLSYKNNAVEEQ